jgi:hypothetical protein
MVTRDQCIQTILERFPGFADRWRTHREWWGDDEAGLCNDVAAFGDYIADQIKAGFVDHLPAMMAFLEELLVEGDEEVQTAVTTCCLENLLNYCSAGRIQAESFTHLLGPKSRAYCKAWDEFTGVETPGV